MKKFFALLITLPLLLALASCGSKAGSITVYTHINGETEVLEIDLDDYQKDATFYDVLLQDDTLEADLDKTGEPHLLSVRNVRAGKGESYMLLSSVAADAGPDAHPSVYEEMTFYAVENMFYVKLTPGASYFLVLTREG